MSEIKTFQNQEQSNVTPMMQQYFDIKKQYPDALLFYRLGDFYELFYDDAKIASKELEITLTSRNKNADNPVPMCGFPHHSSSEYIKTLVDKGYKIAICEQLEDPRLTKKMVKRDVVQIITPGTMLDPKNKDEKSNHYLAAVVVNLFYQLAYVDVVTGEIKVTILDNFDRLVSELSSLNVSELVYLDDFSLEERKKLEVQFTFTLSKHIPVIKNDIITNLVESLPRKDVSMVLQLLLSYIFSTQKRDLTHLQTPLFYEVDDFLKLDYNALYNLELTKTTRTKSKKGSLLWIMDETKTAMGGRLLRQWLEKPLIQYDQIQERYNQVEALMNHYFERIDLIETLKSIYDLERLVAKISFDSVNARDLIQLKYSLQQVPKVKSYLMMVNDNHVFDTLIQNIQDFSHIVQLIEKAIVEEPPISIKEGGIIKPNFNELLNTYIDAMTNGKEWIAQLQQNEREKTGIKTLKIGYNKVFGYFIEITKAQLINVDVSKFSYDRKQTLSNAERFITPELKEKERLILEAQEKSVQLEYELFTQVKSYIKEHSSALQQLAKNIASIDVLQSFATISENNHYVKPTISKHSRELSIVEGRHPVVEKIIGIDRYVSNSIDMTETNNILLITGPNMSGKSTYMKQIALTVIMAQAGCFVPCKEAKLPIFDRIFTRIGAADDIVSGQSTFMVEMIETNEALRYATDNSLLLFDEIGRGTATYDGMALAEAILVYVHQHIKGKSLFSTHYHELTKLEEQLSTLKNVHVGAVEEDGKLIFLHQVKDGPADKSYGLHVASLAGLPNHLIEYARVLLQQLEQNRLTNTNDVKPLSQPSQTNLKYDRIIENLKSIDVNNIPPLKVAEFVAQLQEMLNEY